MHRSLKLSLIRLMHFFFNEEQQIVERLVYSEKEFMILKMHFYLALFNGETQLEISKGNCCCFVQCSFPQNLTKK